MRNNIFESTIPIGPVAGKIALRPRISVIHTDLPFQFKRVRLIYLKVLELIYTVIVFHIDICMLDFQVSLNQKTS